MKQKTYFQNRRETEEWRKHLKSDDFNRCLTFNFNLPKNFNRQPIINQINSGKLADTFTRKINRKILGRRDSKKTPEESVRIIGFVEHLETNLHIHAATWVPEDKTELFDKYAETMLQQMYPSATLYIDEVTSGEQREKISHYITKDFSKFKNNQIIFLSNSSKKE